MAHPKVTITQSQRDWIGNVFGIAAPDPTAPVHAAAGFAGAHEDTLAIQGLKQGLMRTAFKTAAEGAGTAARKATALKNESKAGTAAAAIVTGAIDLNKVRHGKMTGGQAIVDTGMKTGIAFVGNEAGRLVEGNIGQVMKGGARSAARGAVVAAEEDAVAMAATEGAAGLAGEGGAVAAGAIGAEEGAEVGAVIGSVEPGGGTAVGMVAGVVIGAAVGIAAQKLMETKTGRKVTAKASKLADQGLAKAAHGAQAAERKLDGTKAGHAVIGGVAAAGHAVGAGAAAVEHKAGAVAQKVAAPAKAVQAKAQGAGNAVAGAAKGVAGKLKKLF